MNAHALAATHTLPPRDESREAWIAHCAAICCAWDALAVTVRDDRDHTQN